MKYLNIKFTIILAAILVFANACSDDDKTEMNENPSLFYIEGSELLQNGNSVNFRGVNALQTFGLGDQNLMNEWNIEIVREFIGNLREQPINGNAILGADNVWYHPLQNIVDSNRANNKITIFCPFGWVNNNGEQTLFTGLNPSSQIFYEDYKQKMSEIAEQFKNQEDVWIEVWNEPFHWNNENNYSHDLWLSDVIDMVSNLRMIDGFDNIILVPGNEQGQSENAILHKGIELLQNNYNIMFDLHAYEKWLINTTTQDIVDRIETIKSNEFPFLFGEIGVKNVGDAMPFEHFLEATKITSTTVLAWLWNKNSTDFNALLTDEGLPHSTIENNFWGSTFKEFLAN